MKRIIILGLDSATFDVIDPLIEQGRLPNFSKLIKKGVRSELISTYPPRTAPAWVTLMTGCNPGKHGIYDFWLRYQNNYEFSLKTLATSTIFAGTTIWDLLSQLGKRVGVLFVPMTFPSWKIQGEMIAGPPLTPDTTEGLCYPLDLMRELDVRHDTHLFPKGFLHGFENETAVYNTLSMEEYRTNSALKLWDTRSYDCFMFVLEGIDILQHYFWSHYKAQNSNYFQDVIPLIYEKADWAIGQILDRLEKNDTLIVLSDHGMTAHPKRCFNTNVWLAANGWLKPIKSKVFFTKNLRNARNLVQQFLPERLYNRARKYFKSSDHSLARTVRMGEQNLSAIDWSKTLAFRVPMPDPPLEGITLNILGRQPRGIVEPDSMKTIASEISKKLLTIRDPHNDQPVVKAVHTRDDLYWGQHADVMPDLIIEFYEDFKGDRAIVGNLFTKTPPIEIKRLSGTHSLRGIFIAYGKSLRTGYNFGTLNIADIAPTLLYMLDQQIPNYMDGKVAIEAFNKHYLMTHKVSLCPKLMNKVNNKFDLTDKERAQIEEKLKALGYM